MNIKVSNKTIEINITFQKPLIFTFSLLTNPNDIIKWYYPKKVELDNKNHEFLNFYYKDKIIKCNVLKYDEPFEFELIESIPYEDDNFDNLCDIITCYNLYNKQDNSYLKIKINGYPNEEILKRELNKWETIYSVKLDNLINTDDFQI